jgi:hypothetical protein
MYIECNGKIYVQKDAFALVGVNITPSIAEVEGTETKITDLEGEVLVLTPHEVIARYNISEQTPYMFPVEKPVEVAEKPKRGTPSTK